MAESTPQPANPSTPPAPTPPPAGPPPPQAPTSASITLKIDGRDVTVPKGTNVLEACLQNGIDVPYFCYHPGLSIAAACRQCLVEIKGQPKLVPSCQAVVADKMEVLTQSEKALVARRQQLEFTLINHPVDCPICDKAGECTLQKLYMEWDARGSRVDQDKVHKAKMVDLGPTIVLDQERCILCSRCIRVCNEVAKSPQLTMAYRRDREVLTTAPGHQLDNPYSLNTVDVCPVGALTSKDFRFAVRAWQLQQTPTVCPGCATGCNVEVHHAYKEPFRLVPRHNPEVNRYWMCDEGRLTYKEVRRARLATPRAEGTPVPWDKAFAEVAKRFGWIKDKALPVGLVLSALAPNEDNYATLKILGPAGFGASPIYVYDRPPRPDRADGILRSADVTPNERGARLIAGDKAGGRAQLERDLISGQLGGVIFVGEATELSAAAREALGRLPAVIAIAAHDEGIVSQAHVALPARLWAEVDGTFTNEKGRTQRLRAAVPGPEQSLPAWMVALRLGGALGVTTTHDWAAARAVFLDMQKEVAAFAGVEFGRDLPTFQLRFANSRG